MIGNVAVTVDITDNGQMIGNVAVTGDGTWQERGHT